MFRRFYPTLFLIGSLLITGCEHDEKIAPYNEISPNITNIELEGIVLSQPFSPVTRLYLGQVPFETEAVQLNIWTRRQQPDPMIYVNGELSDDRLIKLEPGQNKVRILEMGPDISNGRVYTFIIIRSTSPYLTSLAAVTKDSSFPGAGQNFNKYDSLVSFNFPREVSEVAIRFEQEDSLATTTIIYRSRVIEDNVIPLSVGDNKCQVEVTSADKRSVKTYNLTITRTPKKDASLHDITFSAGELTPPFSPSVHTYELYLSEPAKNLSFQTSLDEFASQEQLYDNIRITGEISQTSSLLKNLQIKILADDSVTTDTYDVRVYHQSWEFLGRGPFDPRDGAGVVNFKGKLWLLGGWEVDSVVSEVWSSSDAKAWQFMGNAPWKGRHCAGFVVFNDRLWVVGGDGWLDVWSSDDGLTWQKELDNAPWGRRYAPYVAVYDNKLWLMGGTNFYAPDQYNLPSGPQNDIWNSNDGIHWQKVGYAPWAPRGLIHGYVVFDNKLWVVGGGSKSGTSGWGYSDVWNTTDGITWNLVTSEAPWAGRYHFSVCTFDNKIWLTDGSIGDQNNLSNEVWYSADGKNWQQLKNTRWPPTHASSLVPFGGNLYIICGYIRNDIWRFNLTP